MKLLTDQCLRGLTVRLLRDSGHDVTWLRELGQQKATDAEVLQLAHQLDAVLVTVDLDFSNILAYPPSPYSGIVVLRMKAATQAVVHQILLDFLDRIDRETLRGALVVINQHGYRIRR